ncbi:PREDICTED: sialic acid-binding Ig-like lectin 11-like [Chrysochloris asiatica]|uniref:Sialic acid-binding Ig-like lectin 11-like n=1 Tax=Chrysochloris asiatica TaxID=185453 RepID=A0A9B0WVE7_CHRAS|nr:PREDICTED: sialic acid-binding Ig-like lectin 11-like [Chrysochloris asiatica]
MAATHLAGPSSLSQVSLEVRKIPVEKGLCITIPCKSEFPEGSLSDPRIIGYWLNKNISSFVATNKPNVTIEDDTKDRFLVIGNLEEQDCTLLIHDIPQSDSMTYLFYADLEEQRNLTQKPELHIPEIIIVGEPVTLTCSIKDTCKESKALYLTWKGPTVSSNMGISSSDFSSMLHFTPKPEDHGATLRCPLNVSRANMTRTPPRLLSFSCSLKKTLQCRCAFHAIPIPSVYWWMGDVLVDVNSMYNIFHVTSTTFFPWVNSTIRLIGDPEVLVNLRCEGRNPMKILKWCERRQMAKTKEGLILKNPALLEKTETLRNPEAQTPPAQEQGGGELKEEDVIKDPVEEGAGLQEKCPRAGVQGMPDKKTRGRLRQEGVGARPQ